MVEHSVGEVGGEAIRAARRRGGRTLRQLAADVGVSAGTMSAIENGKVALTLARLHEIARALGVPATDLLEARTPPPPVRLDASASWRDYPPLDLDPVLTSAVDVFYETGYHGATMRVIATGANISVAGIYHHYPSKQQILVALLDLALDEQQRHLAAAARVSDDPVEGFAQMVEALALFHAERTKLAFILGTEMRRVEPPEHTRMAAEQRQIHDRLNSMARRAVDQGRFRVPDLGTAIQAIVAMCLGLPQWLSATAPVDRAQLARSYADLALDMMRLQRD